MPATPAQVAKQASVSVQSIRNWTRDYAELLSPQARGETGPRLFNDQDVEILCVIASLRKSGVPPSEVADRVRNHDSAPTIVDAAPQNAPQSPQTAPESSIALYTAHNALQARIDAVERQIVTYERRQHDRIIIFTWGAAIGMVGAILLLLAAYLLVTIR